MARAQGRLAGASASGYLGLSSDKELREKTAFCNTEINRARIVSLPFMPDIIKGREIMNRHWNQTRKNQPETTRSFPFIEFHNFWKVLVNSGPDLMIERTVRTDPTAHIVGEFFQALVANPEAGHDRPPGLVAGMKMDEFIPGFGPGVQPFLRGFRGKRQA